MRRWLPLLLALGAVAACGPTYPKTRVVQAVVDLCRAEYHLEAQAVLQGNTLAVLLPATHLFESPVTITSETDVRLLNQQLKFSPQGMDQLQHVALIVRRVILSTDAPIEFYLVMIRDAEGGQVELRWLGHILDLKRLNAMDISQGEFLKYRSVIYFRAVPAAGARRTVEQLFEDVRHRAPVPTIAKHFSSQADLRSLLPFLVEQMVPASRPGEGMATLAEIRTHHVGSETVLVFARTLVPSTGVQPVREQGYYFVVETGELRGVIRQVIPVALRPFPDATLGRWLIPKGFARYGPPERWGGEELFVEPVQLPAFLAEQVARRVRVDLAARPQMAGLAVVGEYAGDAFQFQFRLGSAAPKHALPPRKGAEPDPATPQGLATILAQTTATVVRSYEFTAFKRVLISEADSGATWAVTAEQLPFYRVRHTLLVPAVAS